MNQTRSVRSGVAVVGVAVALLLGACASHSTATTHLTTASAPSTKVTATQVLTPSSVPTVASWSMSEAQSHWLAMTEGYRRDLGTLVTLGRSNSNDLARWSKTCDAIGSDELQLTADVAAGQWPAKEMPIASDLIDRLRIEAGSWGICKYAQTAAAASSTAADLLSPSSPLLAQRAKVILGVQAMDGALGLHAQ